MKILIPGMFSQEALNRLLQTTSIKSDTKLGALSDMLVKGAEMELACLLNGQDKSNFQKTLVELEKVAQNIEQIIINGIHGK